ncbi:SIR2 family NAD-dependent protein deacylase [Flavimarina sp. Hel_I_48]|uniref:SIR2 family NAD-dependent protein deacylase n=1 Tax=Flavimarina sp. Hel_I_48 TaxID=1392488 RepID=UPI0004DFCBB1|nr:NAD-dependent deacylase [Flavimarina sp. Hel_I_48]
MLKKIFILTGAGISAESGLKTFRDADGLWEGHDIMDVATPEGWKANQELVLDFYNQRRKQLLSVQPNAAHKALVELEEHFDVTIITQNVDDLHERAGSKKVIHLHGELLKARSSADEHDIVSWQKDIKMGDLCAKKSQMRPHVVWFGEAVPLLDDAARAVMQADIVLIVGTSMQVYPAAGLIDYAPANAELYFIDPQPNIQSAHNLKVIAENASTGVPTLVNELIKNT